MLNRIDERLPEDAAARTGEAALPPPALALDFELLLASARRQMRVIVFAVLVCLALGLAYLMTAVPLYTASTRILIDSRRNQDQLSSSIAELNYDTGAIDSQVEVLKSDNVALAAAKALKLDSDPEYLQGSGLFETALQTVRGMLSPRNWFGSKELDEEELREAQQRRVIMTLKNNLDVRRVGRTYVLTIDYTSPNPNKAAAISNAFADAYFSDQLNAKYEETRRASGWLQDRIAELKQSSLESDMAVQRFMAKNGLVSSGDGKFVADQQMEEITAQLSAAHGDVAKAEARLQQINDIIKSGRADVAVAESLGSPIITDLRSKYLKASKTAEELSAKLGINHYQVISLRNEMGQYERLILDELRRIAETYSSDLEVARGHEKTLNESMASLVGQKAVSDETMVQLRELQRESETYKNLYQTFLQRYQEAIQRQSFPVTEARTISAATRPLVPSAPKGGVVMALAGLMGLLMGVGIGALREYRDRVFRAGHQVRDELGLNLVGMLQIVPNATLPAVDPMKAPGLVHVRDTIMRYGIDNPLSGFAETLRTVKVECDLALGQRRTTKIIGIVSVLPTEGKTTISKNLASLIAMQGARTVLIDADLRNPGMTRAIARHAQAGLVEVLRGERTTDDVMLMEPDSGLSFLPAVVKKRLTQSSELLTSQQLEILLAELKTSFDYIVVDLPPVGPVIDVRAAARLFDGFLFVVEWGKTPRSIVKAALRDDDVLFEKCFGVLLNQVDMSRINLYNNDSSKNYYYGKYSSYYIDRPDRLPEKLKPAKPRKTGIRRG